VTGLHERDDGSSGDVKWGVSFSLNEVLKLCYIEAIGGRSVTFGGKHIFVL
jgi:hypothetical protein